MNLLLLSGCIFVNMAAIYENGEIVRTIRSDIMKERYLTLYAVVGLMNTTCNILCINKETVYLWKKADKEFAKKLREIDERLLDSLEDEAYRRGVMGVQKPVFQNGKKVGHVQEYSDSLLILLLKAKAPHKYKERFEGQMIGADGKPLKQENKLVINHIHAAVPIAQREEDIEDIPYELVKDRVPQLPTNQEPTSVQADSEQTIDPLLL